MKKKKLNLKKFGNVTIIVVLEILILSYALYFLGGEMNSIEVLDFKNSFVFVFSLIVGMMVVGYGLIYLTAKNHKAFLISIVIVQLSSIFVVDLLIETVNIHWGIKVLFAIVFTVKNLFKWLKQYDMKTTKMDSATWDLIYK